MKSNNISNAALTYLILGLLLVTLTPIMGRYISIPDFLKGFLNGLGLTLEFIAIVKIRDRQKANSCRKFST
jgi:uncharacterized membrane protein